jgi:hypothetical protein
MSPKASTGTNPFNAAMLPERHIPNFPEFEQTTDEAPFVREGFELLKKASVPLIAVERWRRRAKRLPPRR